MFFPFFARCSDTYRCFTAKQHSVNSGDYSSNPINTALMHLVWNEIFTAKQGLGGASRRRCFIQMRDIGSFRDRDLRSAQQILCMPLYYLLHFN